MQDGMYESGSQSRFVVLFPQAQVHCDNKPQQIGPNHDYNMTLSISPHEC